MIVHTMYVYRYISIFHNLEATGDGDTPTRDFLTHVSRTNTTHAHERTYTRTHARTQNTLTHTHD